MYGFLPLLETPWKFFDDLQRERERESACEEKIYRK
jgi:hypothetical protein